MQLFFRLPNDSVLMIVGRSEKYLCKLSIRSLGYPCVLNNKVVSTTSRAEELISMGNDFLSIFQQVYNVATLTTKTCVDKSTINSKWRLNLGPLWCPPDSSSWLDSKPVLFKKIIVGHKSFLLGHWYPCFGLLATSPLHFTTRVGSLTRA